MDSKCRYMVGVHYQVVWKCTHHFNRHAKIHNLLELQCTSQTADFYWSLKKHFRQFQRVAIFPASLIQQMNCLVLAVPCEKNRRKMMVKRMNRYDESIDMYTEFFKPFELTAFDDTYCIAMTNSARSVSYCSLTHYHILSFCLFIHLHLIYTF